MKKRVVESTVFCFLLSLPGCTVSHDDTSEPTPAERAVRKLSPEKKAKAKKLVQQITPQMPGGMDTDGGDHYYLPPRRSKGAANLIKAILLDNSDEVETPRVAGEPHVYWIWIGEKEKDYHPYTVCYWVERSFVRIHVNGKHFKQFAPSPALVRQFTQFADRVKKDIPTFIENLSAPKKKV